MFIIFECWHFPLWLTIQGFENHYLQSLNFNFAFVFCRAFERTVGEGSSRWTRARNRSEDLWWLFHMMNSPSEIIERLSTTFYAKRQTSACTLFSLLFLKSLNKSIRKIENNSHVHDKRETTLFDVQTANARRQNLDFFRLRENKREA